MIKLNWGWRIAIIYTCFALATLGFMAYAMRQKVELVSDQYYREELNYQQRIKQQQNTNNLPTPMRFHHEKGASSIQLEFPLQKISGSLHLYRPSGSGLDRHIAVQCSDGRQNIDISGLSPGLWIAKAEWNAEGRQYYNEFRFEQ
jgi:hypothetical protein